MGINRLSLIFLGAKSSVMVAIKQEIIAAIKCNSDNKIIIIEQKKNPIEPSSVLFFIFIVP